jgi:DNA invertase Pin-like site-specific DNA recombinase
MDYVGFTSRQTPRDAPSTPAYLPRIEGRDVENQLVQQHRYALAQNWEVTEYIDHQTAKTDDRVQFQALFTAASRREIDVVLVWALDRFTREGVAETLIHIKRLLDYGAHFESLTEAHFRTTGPAGELMIALAAWIAKQERVRISERTKAGLAVARAKGRIGGRRPKVFDRKRAEATVKSARFARSTTKPVGSGTAASTS